MPIQYHPMKGKILSRCLIIRYISIYWKNELVKKSLNLVSRGDGCVILVLGATGLTIHLESWEALAESHAGNKTPTRVIIIESEETLSSNSSFGHYIGGGYAAFEFELPLIARYLHDPEAPPKHKLLFTIWKTAAEFRTSLIASFTAKIANEGISRVVRRVS